MIILLQLYFFITVIERQMRLRILDLFFTLIKRMIFHKSFKFLSDKLHYLIKIALVTYKLH